MTIQSALTDVQRATRETMGGFRNELGDLKSAIGIPARPTREEARYSELFTKWVKSGGAEATRELRDLHDELFKKDVSFLTDPQGGFALPKEVLQLFAMYELQSNHARALATVENVTNMDLHVPLLRRTETGESLGETDTRNETVTPELVTRDPTFCEVSTYVEVSEWAMQDIPNLTQWIVAALADRIGAIEMAHMVDGDGTDEWTGLLAATPVSTTDIASPMRAAGTLMYEPLTSGSPHTLDPDLIIALSCSLAEPYLPGASWLMAKETAKAIRQLRTTGGSQIFPGGPLDPLLGHPVRLTASMPSIAANAHPLLFGDFRRGFIIADRTQLTMSIESVTKPGFLKVRVRRRSGGTVLDGQAVRVGKYAVA